VKANMAAVVNEQLALIPLRVPHTAFVSSAGLTDKGDQVHFNTSSLHEFGRGTLCVHGTGCRMGIGP